MTTMASFARKGIALAVVGTALTLSMANDAEARWRRGGHYRGGGFAAAAIGGLAAGAILGAATAPAYGYSYGYAPAYSAPTTYYYSDPQYVVPSYATPTYRTYGHRPVYRQRVAYGEPVCTITRKKVWLNANTYTFRRATVCR